MLQEAIRRWETDALATLCIHFKQTLIDFRPRPLKLRLTLSSGRDSALNLRAKEAALPTDRIGCSTRT